MKNVFFRTGFALAVLAFAAVMPIGFAQADDAPVTADAPKIEVATAKADDAFVSGDAPQIEVATAKADDAFVSGDAPQIEVAKADDAPVPADPPKVELAMSSAHNWTGFYVGPTAGYAIGTSKQCDTLAACTHQYEVSGFAGGIEGGYNWQEPNDLVLGLEGDFSGADAKGSTSTIFGVFGCGNGQCQSMLDYYGTLRGRVGYSGWDNLLPFVTGGFAYGGMTANIGTGASAVKGSNVEPGWTAGAGVEYAVNDDWSLKFEYQYLSFGDMFFDTQHACGFKSCTTYDNNFSVIRIGANYHF